ncbi:MAG: hypothetical protein ISR48_01270 [Alphaproteobacteria bacterium]|nr:hypothetical protein [Alphaproteobacteria bacterium]
MSTHITIDDITPRIQYSGDGAQTQFTYPFPIFEDADLEVYEDAALQTITTHYTVAGAGNSSGGSVTFVTAPANGVVVTLLRDVAIKRTTDFQEGGAFRAKTINDELDRMTAGLQQVETDSGRGLKLSATDTATSVTLPDKTTRADQLLGFDANGDPDVSPKTGITGPAGPTGPTGAAGSGLFDGSEATVTPATGDKVALLDISDADNPKYATAQSIADLASAPADQTARDNNMLNAFRIAINGGLSVQGMVDGVVDEFEDETGVDTGTSTNETYDATNDYYTNAGSTTQTDATAAAASMGTGGIIANLVVAAGTWDAHDATSWTNEDVRFDMGSAKRVTDMRVKITGTSWGTVNFTFWGTNDTGTDMLTHGSDETSATWTQIGSGHTATWDSPTVFTTTNFTNPTAYRYYKFIITSGQNGTSADLTHVTFGVTTAASNMTLVSNAAANAPASDPSDAHIILFDEDVDTVTLNTDLKAYASRDGGATWTQTTLADQGDYATGKCILTGDADISGQPSGTSMKWKVETLNTKELRLHGVALEWS